MIGTSGTLEWVRHGVVTYTVPAMPQVVHQMWLQGWHEMPRVLRSWRRDWAEINEEWDWQFWDLRRVEDLVYSRYRELRDVWEELGREQPIKRADMGRMIILHAYGGLYVDMDLQPLVRFRPGLRGNPPRVLCVGESGFGAEGHDRIANGFLGCEPGLPVWLRILHDARSRARGKVLDFLGPRVLGPALLRAKKAGEIEFAMVPWEMALSRPAQPGAILHNHEVRSWGDPAKGELWYDV